MLFKVHKPGFENSALPDARPSGIGLERTAELARGAALRPGAASQGARVEAEQRGRSGRKTPKDLRRYGAKSLFRFFT